MAPSRPAVKRLEFIASQLRHYSAPAERSIPPAKQRYVPTSGAYPKGFLAGSAHAGVKPSNTKHDDIALVVSDRPCTASAVFTRNVFQAAPVAVSKEILSRQRSRGLRGVVVNSGCANAVTGKLGLEHAHTMSKVTDECLGHQASNESAPQTLVMSTGVIGQRLPIDRITGAIPKAHASLGSAHEDWMNAAQAICTTDTFPKLISRTFTLPSHPETQYSIAGMTKGAGMIHPNMGTLLGIICTDANLDSNTVHAALRKATNSTFNCISIDGDTSTNDTVTLFANGAAAPPSAAPLEFPPTREGIRQPEGWHPDSAAFYHVLQDFMTDLAQLVVRDGEGATKFVTIRVRTNLAHRIAHEAAVSIATSSLVKTALYGKDANWGRILCAIGYARGIMPIGPKSKPRFGIQNDVELSRTSVSLVPSDGSKELKLLVNGEPEDVDEERAKEVLELEDVEILVSLGSQAEGQLEWYETKFWTCDLSHEYVTINGDYRT